MQNPRFYSIFPRELIQVGVTLEIHLHVYLPANGSLLLFRKAGTTIGPEDMDSFLKIPEDRLLYSDSDAPKLNAMRAKVLSLNVANGELSAPVVKETAAGMLQTLAPTTNLSNCMNQAASLVQNLIREFKNSASVSAYDEVLKRAAAKNPDPLDAHHEQVSTVAVLMALTVGEFSMDDLSDIATAGLVHDLGLRDITHALAESHVKEIRKLENQEKIIYMRHVALTLEHMKKEKIAITPGVQRIIEHHHENWDGSGFKNAAGTKIYRPARILRMADDVVSLVQNSANQIGFQEALQRMSAETGVYDPQMFKTIVEFTQPKAKNYKLEPRPE